MLDKKKDGSLLVISKYGLDCQPYQSEEDHYVTWETCTLRRWMNKDFYNAAFSSAEKAKIRTTLVENKDGPYYKSMNGTIAGNNTEDKIFLLSIEEALKYFANDEGVKKDSTESHARACTPTAYAKTQGAWVRDGNFWNEGNCWWWLRSPGTDQFDAGSVYSNGLICMSDHVTRDDGAVRPAIWIQP